MHCQHQCRRSVAVGEERDRDFIEITLQRILASARHPRTVRAHCAAYCLLVRARDHMTCGKVQPGRRGADAAGARRGDSREW